MHFIRLVSVSFHCAGKIFDFDPLELDLAPGDKVIVETERGRALGTVVCAPKEAPAEEAPPKLKPILRIATASDLAMAAANAEKEIEAVSFCRQRIRERNLEMKLVRAEYLFDGSKVLFYFTADGRIDFRDLVRDLAQQLRTRIEMRQIGVRDEAKLVGGLGICGRELCCSSYLREFAPVSVKMAKAQGLALNPTKISGQCGRLLCCLAYEYENYNEMRKKLPKIGKKVTLPGGIAEVVSLDVLQQSVTLTCPGGERCRMQIEALQKEIAQANNPQEAAVEEPPVEQRKKAPARPEPTSKKAQPPQSKRAKPRRESSLPALPPQPPTQESKPDIEKTATGTKPPRKRRRPRRRSNKPRNPETPTT